MEKETRKVRLPPPQIPISDDEWEDKLNEAKVRINNNPLEDIIRIILIIILILFLLKEIF